MTRTETIPTITALPACADGHDLVVIGGGPAGMAAARRARELGATVALVRPRAQRSTGAVAARVLAAACADALAADGSDGYGGAIRIRSALELGRLRARTDRIGAWQQSRADAVLRSLGVTVIEGTAGFGAGRALTVARSGSVCSIAAGRTLVAVGARSSRPAEVDFDGRSVVPADDVLSLEHIPARLTIVGAGSLGLECASAFATLGSHVFLVEQQQRIPSTADGPAVDALLEGLAGQRVEILTSTHVSAIRLVADGSISTLLDGIAPIRSRGVIWAGGTRGATDGLGLEHVGLEPDGRGRLQVDDRFRTGDPDVFAAGSVVRGHASARACAHDGRAAASAALGSWE